MQKKNLIIALLAFANILCIFIITNQRTVQKNPNYLGMSQVADFSLDQNQIELAKKELFSLYEPSQKTCGAAVSISKRTSFIGHSRFDMACLILGSRKLIWETMQEVKNDYSWELSMLQDLVQAEGIKEMDGVSYRPEGKRDALLFVKQNIAKVLNSYLDGYLLGYDEKDIEFFYLRLPFNGWLEENKKVPMRFLVPFSFADFSTDLKKQFEHYKNNDWLYSKEHARYERDKKNAFAWLAENKKFTDEQLYDQIKNLKKMK